MTKNVGPNQPVLISKVYWNRKMIINVVWVLFGHKVGWGEHDVVCQWNDVHGQEYKFPSSSNTSCHFRKLCKMWLCISLGTWLKTLWIHADKNSKVCTFSHNTESRVSHWLVSSSHSPMILYLNWQWEKPYNKPQTKKAEN